MQIGEVKDAVLRLGGSTALDRERGLTALRKLLAAAGLFSHFGPCMFCIPQYVKKVACR